MRSSLLRDRLCGIELIGEDLPYADQPGRPRPEGTRLAGHPGRAASPTGRVRRRSPPKAFYMPWLVKLLKAAGADVAIAVPRAPVLTVPHRPGPGAGDRARDGGNADGEQTPGPASPTRKDATTTSTISSSQTARSSRPRAGTTRPSRSWRQRCARPRSGQVPESWRRVPTTGSALLLPGGADPDPELGGEKSRAASSVFCPLGLD